MLSGIKSLSGDDQTWIREEFSHAAICVGTGTFVEALGSVGVCRLAIRQTAARDRDNIRVLRLNREVPDAAAIAARAGALAEEFTYRRYAEGKNFAGMLFKGMQDTSRERLFCSQLVAAAFAEAGFRLFEDMAPEQLSPGRLARCELLEDITDRCIATVISDDAPEFYLDAVDRSERSHHAEVKDFQEVLHSKEVRRALRKLGINRPPATLLLLQAVLIETRDANLNDAIRKKLSQSGYREVEPPKVSAKARELLVAVQGDVTEIKEKLFSMSDGALLFWLRDVANTVAHLDEDLTRRREQVRGYEAMYGETRLSTFRLLHCLWERRTSLIEQVQKLTRVKLQILFAEAQRRELTAE